MTLHSSIVGGSTARRLIACPGSYQASLHAPEDIPSEYAEEGTAMHAVMEALMSHRAASDRPITLHNMVNLANSWIGQYYYDRALTRAHVVEMIEPALTSLAVLEKQYGGKFEVMGVEAGVRFPGIIGAFGTDDVILVNDTHVLHVDWKFGAGVPVVASYDDGTINSQLMFYVTAARATFPRMYRNGRGRPRTMVGAIIQPRSDTPLSHVEISGRAINRFKKDLIAAVDIALRRDPPRAKGEHCRFAACKLDCPLWTGPLLDLSALMPVKPDSPSREVTAYGRYLAHAKTLVDMLAMMKKEIDEQMHTYLDGGGTIPGWRLKLKTKQRQWIDPEIVAPELKKLGFKHDEIWQTKLQTFQIADAAARRLGVEIPDNLRVAPPTSETTIATTNDPAPVVERQLVIEQFRASLAKLAG